ncbi:response regulator transcription factor [Xenophilus sp.]|uniref:response regulator transcription factor n=1 Tax=Xenophilus sp. TaxID=1873499 RepID=UPI0037DD5C96
MTPHARLRIAVRHDEDIVAAGLAGLIARQADFELVEHDDAQVAVADVRSALRLLAEMSCQERAGRMRVIAIARAAREAEIARAIDAGVSGYLLHDATPDELAAAIRHAARGGAPHLSRGAMATVHGSLPVHLTPREADVLQFVVQGECNKAIARRLAISASTVKAHVANISGKLHAGSRTQVAVAATRRGLVGVQGPGHGVGAAP